MRTKVHIPESIDLNRAQIAVQYSADNQISAVRVNGYERPVKGPLNTSDDTNEKWSIQSTVLSDHLAHGVNTIEFVVINIKDQHQAQSGANRVGLIIDWQLMVNSFAMN